MRKFKITKPTWFKKDTIAQASDLPYELKYYVEKDVVLEALAFRDIGSHYTVTLSKTLGKYNTWNIYKSHLCWLDEVKPITSSTSHLIKNFPYLSQTDNKYNPYGACNVTSVAMCLAYYGMKPLNNWEQFEDELYRYMTDRGLSRHSPYHLQKVTNIYGKPYGIKNDFSERRTVEDIKSALLKNFPVIVHGYFTAFGHIVVIVGFNQHGFIVNDPYGEYWDSGYDRNTLSNPNKGRNLIYSYSLMNRLLSPEGPGHIFAHIISKT
jgi:uncharacterized protein YvpB